MNVKLLVIGVLLGLCAAGLTGYYIHSEIATYQTGTGPDWALETILAIPKDGFASQANVKAVQLPEGMTTSALGAVPSTQLLVIEGRRLNHAMERGKVLFWSDLVSIDQIHPDPLPRVIEKGKRAITIPVSQISGAGGWIRPGDTIDLLGVFTPPNATGQAQQAMAITVLQNQRVLATGIETSADPSRPGGPHPYGDLTLLVTPQDAERLVFAMRQGGALTAVLRAAQDTDKTAVEPVRWDTFSSAIGTRPTSSP